MINIKCAVVDNPTSGHKIITFPITFTQTPCVLCMPHETTTNDTVYAMFGHTITNSQFTVYQTNYKTQYIIEGY